MKKKNDKNQIETDLEQLKKLMMLQLYYVHEVPAELIGKIVNMNANSVRNMIPKEKLKGRTKISKRIKKSNR